MTWPTERIVTKEGTVTTERIVTREGNNIVAERIVITDDDKVVSVERIVSGIMTSRYTTPSSDLRVSPRSYDESPKTTPETRAARMVAPAAHVPSSLNTCREACPLLDLDYVAEFL